MDGAIHACRRIRIVGARSNRQSYALRRQSDCLARSRQPSQTTRSCGPKTRPLYLVHPSVHLAAGAGTLGTVLPLRGSATSQAAHPMLENSPRPGQDMTTHKLTYFVS